MSTPEFVPIEADDEYGGWGGTKDFDAAYNETSHREIEALLLGRRVRVVADDHIELDDGTLVKLVGHDGGCACSAGCYDLTALNGTDNIITAVEFEDDPGGDDRNCRTCGDHYCWQDGHDNGSDGTYRIFVLAGDERINLATFEGSDGNGYYGTGYHVLVRRPAARP